MGGVGRMWARAFTGVSVGSNKSQSERTARDFCNELVVPSTMSARLTLLLSHLGLPMLTLLDISTWSRFHPQNSLLGALKIGEQLRTAAVFGICPMFGKLPSDYANSLCHWQDSVPCHPL